MGVHSGPRVHLINQIRRLGELGNKVRGRSGASLSLDQLLGRLGLKGWCHIAFWNRSLATEEEGI